ncbi:helix-turn-helix domain-containing protein [Vagococcus salmoninarum]|uniref:helix-turn-helix domain-containing protein n=1 Tax=Vagococcus salmoninarum TaxID=2739 RepID=UPI001881B2F9|nr:helix-turn-helix transcriptional regulator [Vagococcus salmoninarum]MBE9389648.1 helix-turn-helix transcriptional regulator [Vagococcus salmoninarum]
MNIAEQLKLARKARAFTQQEVAEVLHVTRATISSWEVGRTYPSLDLLVALSNLYDLSLDTLLKGDVKMVEKVSKDVKQKQVYQRIVMGIVGIVSLFILINIVWLSINQQSYQYLDKQWQAQKDAYELKEGDVTYRAHKKDVKSLFRNHYLKKADIWVMSWVDNREDPTGYGLNLTIANRDELSMLVEVGNSGTGGSIYVDKNMTYLDHKYTTELLQNSAHPEDLAKVKEFLAENQTELKELYRKTQEQYELVNNKQK